VAIRSMKERGGGRQLGCFVKLGSIEEKATRQSKPNHAML
jgi:hypothetical protein